MQADRYSRQTILPEIGSGGQAALSRASVLCIGAGGLGTPALLYLAAAGIGRITIVDDDRVDESNLQRQILFTTDDIGRGKAEAARGRLCRLNPGIEIKAISRRLDAVLAAHLVPQHDMILDGSDNFETRFLINDAAMKYGRPWVYGAIQGFDGQVAVFTPGQGGACYRCLCPDMPRARITNCAESGVLGAAVGMIGLTQALQVIQMIVGGDGFMPLRGRMWVVDTRTMQGRTLSIPPRRGCRCAQVGRDDVVLRDYTPHSCATESSIAEILPGDLPEKANTALILDVREAQECAGGMIDGALHCPLSALRDGFVPPLPRDRDIILYCHSGTRSLEAGRILRVAGYTRLLNLGGGYAAYRAKAGSMMRVGGMS